MRIRHGDGAVGRAAACTVVMFLAMTAAPAGAVTLRARVDLERQDLTLLEAPEGTRVVLRGATPAGEPQGPALPMLERTFYVPEGFDVRAVRVLPREETTVAEGVRLARREAPADDRTDVIDPLPAGAVVEGSGTVPSEAGMSLGGGNLGGFRVHSVALFPVRWEEARGRLTFTRSFDVELDLGPATTSGEVVRRRPSPRADEIFRSALASLVVNPSDLPGEPLLRSLGEGPAGFAPEELPSLEGSGVDMVIVTSEALAPGFQPLADWKTKKGVPTVVRTVEWIDTNYPAGHDQPERVRAFLKDAYEKWGTYLALLGGDHPIVTPRHAWSVFYIGGTEIPTDQYFACLDGDWNADGDQYWGEGRFLSDPGDSADIYPDLFVGRAAVEDSAEVANFVAKSLIYDRTPPAGYVEDHGALAEVLFPKDWEYGVDSLGAITMDGRDLVQDSLDIHVPGSWSRTFRFQSENNEDRPLAMEQLRAGHHLLTIVGHGDAFKFSVGNGLNPLIHKSDTDTLTTGDRLAFVMSVACNPNEIDLESQGESMMNDPNGLAVAVFGSSRVDFPNQSTTQQSDILQMAFGTGATRFGAFTQLGRLRVAGTATSDQSADRWTWLTKMLLGDPELRLWRQEPGNLVVSHAPSVALDALGLAVTVTDTTATPVANALVCLSDTSGTYSRALTNGSGIAVLPVTSSRAGVADVVVTKQDFRPHEGTVTITAPSGPHLAETSYVLDDDAVGGSSGNGDGVLDAGETVELAVTVGNGGGSVADSVTLGASVEPGSQVTFDFLWNGFADTALVYIGPDRVNPVTIPFTLDFAAPSPEYIGKPRFVLAPDSLYNGQPSGDEGIFLWQDRTGWHLRWGGHPDSVTVSGTISTDGHIRRVEEMLLESSDTRDLSAGEDSLTFSATTSILDPEDGLDLALADSTMLTVTSPSAPLGAIPAGSSAAGTVVFAASPGARRGQVAYVDLSFALPSGGPWQGEIALAFAAPELVAYMFTVDDSSGAPISGNGNGVVEVGETVRLVPTVANRGDGAADAVTGAASAATGITFVDAADSYGDIASLAESAGTDGYVFTVDDSTGTLIDLTLQDALGRSWAGSIDFVAPPAPDSVWFTSTPDEIDVMWTIPAGAADLAGYRVYRSGTQGSGHVAINYELLRTGARYADLGLSLGSTYYYYVTAVDSSGNESAPTAELEAWTTQPQVAGWPQFAGAFIYPGLTMADADRSGQGEIYLGSHDYDFYAWDFDGSPRAGFPVATSFEVWSTAAVADLDRNGDDEILFGGRDSRFYAVHHDGSPVFGSDPWLVDLPGTGEGVRSAIAVADIDQDDRLEFVFGTDIGTVYAFNDDGTGVTDSTGLLFTALPGDPSASIWGTLAVADLEQNGSVEIVFATFKDSLYVIDAAGALRPGFPRYGGGDFRGGPVVGDLDHDGTMEIVAGNFDGKLYVYEPDGSDYVPGAVLASLPQSIGGGATLANLDADPELEILVGCFDGNLYAFNHDGSSFLTGQGGIFAALPKGPGPNDGIIASPIVVDVDGDGDFEIFVGSRNGNFYGFHHDGSLLPGLPIPTGNKIFGSAAAGDLDGDGDVDVAFASYDASVNVLDFPGASTPDAYEWPTYGANNGRTSAYGDRGPAVGVEPSGAGGAPLALALGQNLPNPFAGPTTIAYVVPRPGRVTLKVFNVSGRLVRTLLDGVVPAGPGRVEWDGRDGRGRSLSSGIYFYRLDNGERTVTRKGVLLR